MVCTGDGLHIPSTRHLRGRGGSQDSPHLRNAENSSPPSSETESSSRHSKSWSNSGAVIGTLSWSLRLSLASIRPPQCGMTELLLPCPFSYFLSQSLSEFSIGGKQDWLKEKVRGRSVPICVIYKQDGTRRSSPFLFSLYRFLSAGMTAHYNCTFWISWGECDKSALCALNSLQN